MGRRKGSGKTADRGTWGTVHAADPGADGTQGESLSWRHREEGGVAGQRQLDINKETGRSLGVPG